MPEESVQITTQEVFALRKAGKSAEALSHARRLYGNDPKDPWTVKALFWCLYDEVKRVGKDDGAEIRKSLLEEVAGLELPNEEQDALIHEAAGWILGSDPCARATELSRKGKHREAVLLLRPVAKKAPKRQVAEAYGWVLYRKLKDCAAEDPRVPVWCLNEFTNCWSSDWGPSVILFKCLLIQAKIHAESWSGLPALVEKLGLHRLPVEDFEDDRNESDFAPFQDQLLGAIYKSLKKHPAQREERQGLQQWLAAWRESFGKDEWPQYHLGRVLSWIGGNHEEARSLLLKTVQRKPDDFWRWHALAEVLPQEEGKIALSRGILCRCEDSSFKVPLYKKYSDLLANEGELEAARASLAEAIRLRQLAGNEWREPLPGWYDRVSADRAVTIQEYAAPFAAEADRLLASDLPTHLCIQIRALRKADCYLYYCVGAGTRTLKFGQGNAPSTDVAAIEATFHDKPDGVCLVLAWQAAALPDDLGDHVFGVVKHVNAEKRLVAVTTQKHEFIPLHFDRWNGVASLTEGACVELRYVSMDDARPMVLCWARTVPRALVDFFVPVKGRFELAPEKLFGFIQTKDRRIYVPPPEAERLNSGSETNGWAIRSKDKHGQPSWKFVPTVS